ncbi:MAG: ABC transporter ATP-binding protein/permease [Malacoplasma sp.]|nr:ABC transporter ATP-binding protein/permease [Malacoplasma sp.]
MKGKNKLSYFTIFKRLVLMLQKNKKAFYGAIFLSLLKTTFSVATSIGLGVVIQNGFLGEKPDFIYLAVGSLLIFLGYTFYFVAYIISQKIILKITYNVGYSIRQLFFDKIRKMPFKIVEQAARGDLISKGTTDTNALAINLSVCIGDIFTAPLVIIGVLVGLLIISPLLTFITLVFYIVLISVSLTVSLKATPKYMKMQEEVGKLNGVVEEYVTGRKAVKSFGYEQKAMELFSKVNESQASESRSAETRLNLIWPWNDFLETVMYAFLYFIGIIFLMSNENTLSVFFPTFEIGLLTSFVLLARIATGETSNSLRLMGTLQKTAVASNRIFDVLDQKDAIDEGKIETKFKGEIEFKNVCFSYSKDKPVLKNVSFKIKPNETVAIVGPTGSGKTTMTSLLSRFYEIDSGEILVDGINIKDIKQDCLFKNISIVLQDPFLFSESVEKNIWYGNTHASMEKVIEVSKKANVDYFIKKLPLGYQTIMSEKMSDLSLGQIQLVSIARAFMSEAKILVLDEATSSVDTKTEIDIQNALMKITSNKTVIVIAHRLSTVVKADKIIVLKDGEIQEIGSHKQLLKNKGFYYSLYKANTVMEDHE